MGHFLRFLLILAWLAGLGLTSAVMLSAGFYIYSSPQLPDVETLRDAALQTPLRIYTSDDKLVGEFGEIRRSPVQVEDLPNELIQAFLSAEDARFYEHGGIDLLGLARASMQLVSTGSIQSGGSTITMQVAKNFFLSNEKTFTRKFTEILLALKIENELSKNEILGLYLNKIFLGNRAYGVQAAARIYYGEDARELSLAQMAMIAGLPKAPSRYNPIVAPERATLRRNWILSRMLEREVIDQEQYDTAIAETVSTDRYNSELEYGMPYVAELGRQEAIERFGESAYERGLNVQVSVDSELQKLADSVIKKGLLTYSLRHGYYGPWGTMTDPSMTPDLNAELDDEELPGIASRIAEPEADLDIRLQVLALLKLQDVFSHTLLQPAWVSRVKDGSARLLRADGSHVMLVSGDIAWARPYETADKMGPRPVKVGDALKFGDLVYISPRNALTLPDLPQDSASIYEPGKDGFVLSQVPRAQAALVAMEPQSGAIRALVGGFDFGLSKFNRAWQARRQAGSNIKPFIYLAALEDGETAASIINDAPVVFDDPKLEDAWRPENSSGRFYGPTRLRKALYLSRNLVSVRLLKRMGVRPTINFISSLGFDPSRLPKDLSLALGSADFTPVEMATGYSLLANGGRIVPPHVVNRITDAGGQELFERPSPAIETLKGPVDPRSVFIIDSILGDVIQRGTGRAASVLNRSDLRGKTGTTNDQVDAWFSGYNKDLVVSVWIGFDQPQTLGRGEYGGRAALPMWIDFMRDALKTLPPPTKLELDEEGKLVLPEGIVSEWIDADTAEPALPRADNAIQEYFKAETAPESLAVQNLPWTDDGDGASQEGSESPQEYLPPESIF